MSRIGKQPIAIPDKVTVSVDGQTVKVEGPAGTSERTFHREVTITVEDNSVCVTRNNEGRIARGQHGLTRTLVANMVAGVVKPFRKSIEISGVGYRAEQVGQAVRLQVGLSHEVLHPIPDGVKATFENEKLVHFDSIDKQLVGQLTAALRAYRPCEPYNGKGIKYVGERVRRKEGKTGAA